MEMGQYRDGIIYLKMVPRGRIGLPTHGFSKIFPKFPLGSDYIIPPEAGWALVGDYCWDSLHSLYTFLST